MATRKKGGKPDVASSGDARHDPFAALRGIAFPSDPKPVDPEPPEPEAKSVKARITVRRERAGHGGKTVTILEGPGLAGRPLEVLAQDLKRALGTSARVEAASILVQGDQPDRVVAWLVGHGFVGAVRGN